MFSNFPKERTQVVTPTVNYCSAKNSCALELSEQMTFSMCWDGGGGGTGWLSESYCTRQAPAHWQAVAPSVRTVAGEKLASVFCIMENFINQSPFLSLSTCSHILGILTFF